MCVSNDARQHMEQMVIKILFSFFQLPRLRCNFTYSFLTIFRFSQFYRLKMHFILNLRIFDFIFVSFQTKLTQKHSQSNRIFFVSFFLQISYRNLIRKQSKTKISSGGRVGKNQCYKRTINERCFVQSFSISTFNRRK